MTDGDRESTGSGDLKRKLIRGGILVGVLLAVAAGIIALLLGLGGVRSAIAAASGGWVAGAAGIQLVGIAGAVVLFSLCSPRFPIG